MYTFVPSISWNWKYYFEVHSIFVTFGLFIATKMALDETSKPDFALYFFRISSHALHVTITICPGPLVHRMGKMSWRNDNGEEGLSIANLGCSTSNVIKGIYNVYV